MAEIWGPTCSERRKWKGEEYARGPETGGGRPADVDSRTGLPAWAEWVLACRREERELGRGGRGRGSWVAAAVGLRRPSG